MHARTPAYSVWRLKARPPRPTHPHTVLRQLRLHQAQGRGGRGGGLQEERAQGVSKPCGPKYSFISTDRKAGSPTPPHPSPCLSVCLSVSLSLSLSLSLLLSLSFSLSISFYLSLSPSRSLSSSFLPSSLQFFLSLTAIFCMHKCEYYVVRMSACAFSLCLSLCLSEREREREREGDKEKERERER